VAGVSVCVLKLMDRDVTLAVHLLIKCTTVDLSECFDGFLLRDGLDSSTYALGFCLHIFWLSASSTGAEQWSTTCLFFLVILSPSGPSLYCPYRGNCSARTRLSR
jgi:hypothetical protein